MQNMPMQQPAASRPRAGILPSRRPNPEGVHGPQHQFAAAPTPAGPSRPPAARTNAVDLPKIKQELNSWADNAKRKTLPPPPNAGFAPGHFGPQKNSSIEDARAAVLKAATSNATSLQIHSLEARRPPSGAISELQGLQHLGLTGTRCTEIDFSPNFDQLKKLELAGNYELKMLPENIRVLTALTTLDIRNSPLLKSLPTGIGALKQLETLTVVGTSIKQLPVSDDLSKSLQTLEISQPRLPRAENGLQNLPENIGLLKSLTTLKLRGQEGLKEVPASLGDLTELKTLDLAGCSNLKNLPDLSKLSKLETLNLSGCVNLNPLPQSLANLPAGCKIIVDNSQQRRELQALRPRQPAAAGTPGRTHFQARPPEETAAREQKLENWTNQLKPFKDKGEHGATRFNLFMRTMVSKNNPGNTDMDKMDALVKAAVASPDFRTKLFAFAVRNVEVPRTAMGRHQTDRAKINPLLQVDDAHKLLIEHQVSDPRQMNADQAYGTLKQLMMDEQNAFGKELARLSSDIQRPGAVGSQHARVPPILAAYVQTHDPVASVLMAQQRQVRPADAAAMQEALHHRYAVVAKQLTDMNFAGPDIPSSSASPRR
jgi:hypothetical protein